MLVLTKYILKNQLKPLSKHFTVKDLVKGARKVLKGLGNKISTPNNKNFSFYKVRIGSIVKGRMIVFLTTNNKIVPLLIKLKKDKKMGMNMSANNPYVVEQIDKNLKQVIRDIENGDFEELSF